MQIWKVIPEFLHGDEVMNTCLIIFMDIFSDEMILHENQIGLPYLPYPTSASL